MKKLIKKIFIGTLVLFVTVSILCPQVSVAAGGWCKGAVIERVAVQKNGIYMKAVSKGMSKVPTKEANIKCGDLTCTGSMYNYMLKRDDVEPEFYKDILGTLLAAKLKKDQTIKVLSYSNSDQEKQCNINAVELIN